MFNFYFKKTYVINTSRSISFENISTLSLFLNENCYIWSNLNFKKCIQINNKN